MVIRASKRSRDNIWKDRKRSLLATWMYCSCFHGLYVIFFISKIYILTRYIAFFFLRYDSFWFLVNKTLDSNYSRQDILEFGLQFHVAFIEEESKSKLFWFKILSFRTGKLERENGQEVGIRVIYNKRGYFERKTLTPRDTLFYSLYFKRSPRLCDHGWLMMDLF